MVAIRKAQIGEAEDVFCLVSETIKVCYKNFYSDNIVRSFIKFHSLDSIMSDIISGICFLCVKDQEIFGTITIDGEHIRRLFVLPKWQHFGCGTFLLRFAEKEISAFRNAVRVDSSAPAEKFYERNGYALKRECCAEFFGEQVQWKIYEKKLGGAE